MSEFSEIPLKRVNYQELINIAKKDLAGLNKAGNLVLSDQTDLFLSQNPDWQFKEEFQRLLELGENRTDEQRQRLMDLVTVEMGLDRERLEYGIMRTYANQNDYEIIEQ